MNNAAPKEIERVVSELLSATIDWKHFEDATGRNRTVLTRLRNGSSDLESVRWNTLKMLYEYGVKYLNL